MPEPNPLDKLFIKVTKNADKLAQEIAGLAYNTNTISTSVSTESGKLTEASQATENMAQNNKISNECGQKLLAINKETEATLIESTKTTESMTSELNNLVSGTVETAMILQDLESQIGDLPEITNTIESIGHNLEVLSINALIQAAAAGEEGKSFSVVASEMKQLATNVTSQMARINKILETMSNSIKSAFETSSKTKETAMGVSDGADKLTNSFSSIEEAFSQTKNISIKTAELATDNADRYAEVALSLDVISKQVENSNGSLKTLDTSVEQTVVQFEELTSILNQGDLETDDTKFINLAISSAKEVEEIFIEAISSKAITNNELFDTKRIPIEGTNPKQFDTGFLKLADSKLPKIQERVCDLDDRIAFCAAVASPDGYLPTHNLKYSKSQKPVKNEEDLNWNIANCRNRRIFSDRTGLAAALNKDTFKLMTYCRDMGGELVIMRDVSAPIFIDGRHWGGFRIGYKS